MSATALLHYYGFSESDIERGVGLVRAALEDDRIGPAAPEEIALLTMYVVGEILTRAGYDARIRRTA